MGSNHLRHEVKRVTHYYCCSDETHRIIRVENFNGYVCEEYHRKGVRLNKVTIVKAADTTAVDIMQFSVECGMFTMYISAVYWLIRFLDFTVVSL